MNRVTYTIRTVIGPLIPFSLLILTAVTQARCSVACLRSFTSFSNLIAAPGRRFFAKLVQRRKTPETCPSQQSSAREFTAQDSIWSRAVTRFAWLGGCKKLSSIRRMGLLHARDDDELGFSLGGWEDLRRESGLNK